MIAIRIIMFLHQCPELGGLKVNKHCLKFSGNFNFLFFFPVSGHQSGDIRRCGIKRTSLVVFAFEPKLNRPITEAIAKK